MGKNKSGGVTEIENEDGDMIMGEEVADYMNKYYGNMGKNIHVNMDLDWDENDTAWVEWILNLFFNLLKVMM